MSRKSYERVVDAWKHDRPDSERTLVTDGMNLRSYALKIGYTERNGDKVVLDYTKDGGNFVSQTTSTHVGEAKKVANRVVKVGVSGGTTTLQASDSNTKGVLKAPMVKEQPDAVGITVLGRTFKVSSVLVATAVPFPNSDWNDKTLHNKFRVTVSKVGGGKPPTAKFDWHGSQADLVAGKTKMSDEDLKYAFRNFLEDATYAYMDFEDFCSELGYSETLPRAKKIYKSTQKQLAKVKLMGFEEDDIYKALNELAEAGIQ